MLIVQYSQAPHLAASGGNAATPATAATCSSHNTFYNTARKDVPDRLGNEQVAPRLRQGFQSVYWVIAMIDERSKLKQDGGEPNEQEETQSMACRFSSTLCFMRSANGRLCARRS